MCYSFQKEQHQPVVRVDDDNVENMNGGDLGNDNQQEQPVPQINRVDDDVDNRDGDDLVHMDVDGDDNLENGGDELEDSDLQESDISDGEQLSSGEDTQMVSCF